MGVRDRISSLVAGLLPDAVIAAVEPRVSSLPDRIGARLAPARYAAMPPGPTEPLVLDEAAARLIIGPRNVAGQAYCWARAVDARPDRSALSLVIDRANGFRFAAHRAVPQLRALGSSDWQRAEFAAVVAQASHVLIESAQPLFGPLFRRDIVREVRALQRHGIRVAFVAHGSDVRDVEAHRAREPHSPYGSPELVPNAAELDAAARRTRRVLEGLGLPLFGSTPGVQFDLPTSTWLPVVVEPDVWALETPALLSGPPVVVHAPSNAGLKGSEVADAVLGRLHSEGAIVYRRLHGVEHADVRTAYRGADIVVDSLRMGGYGVAACEAMAAGRLVMTHINEQARTAVEKSVGEQPPVWQADAGTLEQAMRGVLADLPSARRLAARGPAFVSTLHDGRASAAAFDAFLES